MVLYNFKTIAVVPPAKEFVDIVLSKTQRKTPTVVHKGWKVTRIRNFYMRKIKFTQQNYHDKLSQIIEDFPRLDDIHPFYADLINVLYSRDHYKLALGQINTALNLIDNIGKDYLRLLKFGDSLYRCKELKRAALGRMCTVMKKLNASLQYLEQVRQHLARLPSIDPHSRTLMITGYPNVGKSSFINKVSRANVDVQPYAFTTKSLFIGHTDYNYVRWQVIDTPGILDHPLEDRNTIEMQAITALAHLHSTVLFFVDISETCGYSIKQQVSLFHNIKPLFINKPLLVVANKIDLKKWEDVPAEDRSLIESIANERNTKVIQMSNMTEEGINIVKSTGCEMLLQQRVEKKLKSKRVNDVINRIHVAKPAKRDNKDRPIAIPESVLQARQEADTGAVKPKRKTEKEIELEHGGPGQYNIDLKKFYDLPADWKYDVIPEIMDGKNVADFVDPDIDKRLAELEAEEDELARQAEEAGIMDDESDIDEEQKELADKIRTKRKIIIAKRRSEKSNNKPVLPRKYRSNDLNDFEDKLEGLGLNTEKVRAKSKTRGRKRLRDNDEEGDDDMGVQTRSQSAADRSRSRTHSRAPPRDTSAFRDPKQREFAEKLTKKRQKNWSRDMKSGEADRRVFDNKPRHLNSGKKDVPGKHDWR